MKNRLGKLLLVLAMAMALNALGNWANAKDTVRYCNPSKSKPCGSGCIPLDKLCRTSWTTSKSGKRPATASKHYENPTFVTERPTSDK